MELEGLEPTTSRVRFSAVRSDCDHFADAIISKFSKHAVILARCVWKRFTVLKGCDVRAIGLCLDSNELPAVYADATSVLNNDSIAHGLPWEKSMQKSPATSTL